MERTLKVQKEAITRYKRIADLWVAYYVHGEDPLEFGREFYHAVGDLLEGNPLSKLSLYHINNEDVQNVVFTGREKSDDERTEAKQTVE